MTDDTQPEAMDLADWLEAVGGGPSAKRCAALLREQHTCIAELEAQIEALSGAQALSAAPRTPTVEQVEDEVSMGHGAWDMVDPQELIGAVLRLSVAASPTPPEEQAAPKAAPGVGNSGFDHKTAADLLNNKTVSDEAVRTFVAASRWAHDERAALSATLLAMHGVLTSREAEIALLKKALLEAETAPQPAPAPLSECLRLLNSFEYEGDEDSQAKAFFKAHINEDWFFHVKNSLELALAAQGGKA